MLRRKLLSLLLVLAIITSFMLTAVPASAAPGDWQLRWSDEFNGPAGTGVDTGKWVYETGGGGWGNGELENYTNRTENVYLEQDPSNSNNRFLTIKAIKENYGGNQYTSGRIKTLGKFDFTYGKVEMRAKLPYGQGIWPAFWMLGSNINDVSWPDCGEVDIMEFVGSTPSKVYGTIHGPAYNGAGGIGAWHDYPAGFTNDFHTYSIEWEPNVIRWYFDGQLYQQRTPDDLFGRTWVFDRNFFMLLNLAVGGAWPGVPDASTVFPQKYTIDYVRVYQREGGVYPAPVQRSLIQLKSVGNNQFVCADSYNGNLLYANRGAASTWETFEQKDLGNGNIALISLMNYKYASATASGSQLIADKETVGATETFQKITNSDGTISLRCAANSRYVTAPGTAAMAATATAIGNAEKFSVISVNGVQPPSQVAAPTFNPAGGTYASAQNVTISCGTSGATIKYTTDGSTPTSASATYAGPINVTSTTTIKAYAIKSGLTDSSVATATYTIGSAPTNIALNKNAVASSYISANVATFATDGNSGTRWESEFSDPQWIYVDLGANSTVNGVKLNWETASSKSYKIQVSTDANSWTDVYTQTNGAGGAENISFAPATARYVRMYATSRNTAYGHSLWDFEVYGSTSTSTTNLALNKTGTTSSYEAAFNANAAFDGDPGTRWSSQFSDPQWIYVDLGSTKSVSSVKLNWEAAYATAYSIQVSSNASDWNTVYSTTTGDGGIDNISFNPANARYVRMYGTARSTQWGYSLWEFEVY